MNVDKINLSTSSNYVPDVASLIESKINVSSPQLKKVEYQQSSDGNSNIATQAVNSVKKKKKKKKERAIAVESTVQSTSYVSGRHGLHCFLGKDGTPIIAASDYDPLGVKSGFFSEIETKFLKSMFSQWHLGSKIKFLLVWELHTYSLFNELIGKVNHEAISFLQPLQQTVAIKAGYLSDLLSLCGKSEELEAKIEEVKKELKNVLDSVNGFIISQSKPSRILQLLNVKRENIKNEIIISISLLIKILERSDAKHLTANSSLFYDGDLLNEGTFENRLNDIIKLIEYCSYASSFKLQRVKCFKEGSDKIKSIYYAIKSLPRKKEIFGPKFLEVRNWFKITLKELEDNITKYSFEFCRLKQLFIIFDSYVVPPFFPYFFSEADCIDNMHDMFLNILIDGQNIKNKIDISFQFDKKIDSSNKSLIGLVEQIKEDHRKLFLQYFQSMPFLEIAKYQEENRMNGLQISAKKLLPYFELFQPKVNLAKLADNLKSLQDKHEGLIFDLIKEMDLKETAEIKLIIQNFKENCSRCSQYIASLNVFFKNMLMLSDFEDLSVEILKGKMFSILPELINYMELDGLEIRISSLINIPVEALIDTNEVDEDIEFDIDPLSSMEAEKKEDVEEKKSIQQGSGALKKKSLARERDPKDSLDDIAYPSKGVLLIPKANSKQEKSDRNKTWKVMQRLRSYGCFDVQGRRHIQVHNPNSPGIVTLLSRSSKDRIPRGTMRSINNASEPFKNT